MIMKRRNFLKLAGLAAVNISFPKMTRGSEQKHLKPNVLLIVSDDHGLQAGCYGNKVIKTPNMDKLAAEGTIFTNAYCTTASCSPSRSVILTGLYNHATGQYGLTHAYHHFTTFDYIKSLPVILKQQGYRTAVLGKLNVEPKSVYKFDKTISPGHHYRNTVKSAQACKGFINADNNEPFFLYCCTFDPHRVAHYDTTTPNSFGNKDYDGVKTIKYDPNEVIVPPFLPDTKESREELAQYYESISRLDQGIGALVDILKKSGKYENTLIIYVSDNGPPFIGAKGTAYEAGLHLPCIVKRPCQQKKGIKCNGMVTWADITPTVLDFAGAMPNKNKFHGRSFKPIIETESPDGWDEIYASHTYHGVRIYNPMRVVWYRKYKLIWNIEYKSEFTYAIPSLRCSSWMGFIRSGKKYYGKRTLKKMLCRPEFELYDLEKDPDEIHNLADDPKYCELLEELKTKIKQFQERTKDPWKAKWDYKSYFEK
ncbi:MAG: sulfatase family protein [Planctomycetota bacterium]